MTIKVNRQAIIDKAKNLPKDIAVIECVWDGDSGGWYVDFVAIEQTGKQSYKQHYLGTVGHGMGEYHDFMRALAGETPPYPEGLLAKEIGQEIADMLGVPFYFASPEKPTLDEVPRWEDWKIGRKSSIPIHLIDAKAIIDRFASYNVAIVEAFWGYYHTWHPRMAVIIANNPRNSNDKYTVYDIGKLLWDDQDIGKIIYNQQIPHRTAIEEAKHLGQMLADALNTAFYFESPDDPKWGIPRWIDVQNLKDND